MIDSHEVTDGPLAQLVEQQTLNLRVDGSSPSRLIKYLDVLSYRQAFIVRTHY